MADLQVLGFSTSRNALDTAINFGSLGATFSVIAISDLRLVGVEGALAAGPNPSVSVILDGDDQGPIVSLEFRTVSFDDGQGLTERLIAIIDRSNVADAIIVPLDLAAGRNTGSLPTGTSLSIGDVETITGGVTFVANDTPTPVTAEDEAEVDEDASVLIDVLQNDEGLSLRLISAGAGASGRTVIESDQVRYTPDPDFAGQDRFSYTIEDEIGRRATETVTLNVNQINDAPVLNGERLISLPADRRDVFDFEAIDVEDSEGAGLTFDLAGGVDLDQFEVDRSTGALAFRMIPNPDQPADEDADNTYEVVLRVTDSGGLATSRALEITVLRAGITNPPQFNGPEEESIEIFENETEVLDLTAFHDTDREGAGLVFGLSGGVDQDKFVVDPTTGVVSFSVPPNFEAPDDFDGMNDYEVEVSVRGVDGGSDVKSLIVTVLNDVNGEATNGQDTLDGTSDRDLIDGLGGRDRISGLQDRDTLLGGEGNDVLRGGLDNDNLRGGDGDDVVRGQNGADRMFGNQGNDTLVGSIGDDTLKGNADDDRLTGGGASDRLFGGAGDDTLIGSAGEDRLLGGAGDDVLAGGTGVDRFIFRQNAGDDVILDFEDGSDLMRIQSGAESFTDLTIAQIGANVRIDFTGSSITLRDFEVDDLSAADFLF